jgi:hypothetical protein
MDNTWNEIWRVNCKVSPCRGSLRRIKLLGGFPGIGGILVFTWMILHPTIPLKEAVRLKTKFVCFCASVNDYAHRPTT